MKLEKQLTPRETQRPKQKQHQQETTHNHKNTKQIKKHYTNAASKNKSHIKQLNK